MTEDKHSRRRTVRRRYNQSPQGKTVNAAQNAAWKSANRGRVRASSRKHDLKRYYNLTPEAWEEMFEQQNRRCASCGSEDPGNARRHWSTDHCHNSKKVRGILCMGCNLAIGHSGDDPARLRQMAEYLERADAR